MVPALKLVEILDMEVVDGGWATTALHTVLAFLNRLAEAEEGTRTPKLDA